MERQIHPLYQHQKEEIEETHFELSFTNKKQHQ